ncbi:thyroid receptor-interacting protein 6 isoform X2 [Eurytemora carolleeae]|uniref:thyroid receptor-interacting protein 6 isoform X2 n=1 Tax=Eurytemora carolleeae TaxID=1294199 RepID=UPI000C76ABED|nr:thyroid receptor-interacting protein 6 isoform X2 [Eurytemora carolleeae]|eukprot:XP_023343817.1 thyroid receptor-interacting protein 6-like isoform X2 [Eurytemora affinis]
MVNTEELDLVLKEFSEIVQSFPGLNFAHKNEKTNILETSDIPPRPPPPISFPPPPPIYTRAYPSSPPIHSGAYPSLPPIHTGVDPPPPPTRSNTLLKKINANPTSPASTPGPPCSSSLSSPPSPPSRGTDTIGDRRPMMKKVSLFQIGYSEVKKPEVEGEEEVDTGERGPDHAVEKLDNLISDMEEFRDKQSFEERRRKIPISRQIDIKIDTELENDLEKLTMNMVNSMNGFQEEEEEDEEREVLGSCFKCNRKILNQSVLAGEKKFHEDCFTCKHCNIRLAGKYFVVDNFFYCEFHKTVSLDKCSICQDFITEGGIQTNGRNYHISCFTCSECSQPLSGKFYTTADGKNICELDYKRSREKCFHCSLPMLDQILTALDRKYHPQCFRCALCDIPLDGIPFIQDGRVVNCKDCYARYKAKQCCICGEGIVSSADRKTSLITCEGRSYHEQCYCCKGCGISLTGEYCYTAGDNIFCTGCQTNNVK